MKYYLRFFRSVEVTTVVGGGLGERGLGGGEWGLAMKTFLSESWTVILFEPLSCLLCLSRVYIASPKLALASYKLKPRPIQGYPRISFPVTQIK